MNKSNIIHNRLIDRNSEEKQLIVMTNQISPVLKEIWDNEKDEIYNGFINEKILS